jgi:hypothetical protein
VLKSSGHDSIKIFPAHFQNETEKTLHEHAIFPTGFLWKGIFHSFIERELLKKKKEPT